MSHDFLLETLYSLCITLKRGRHESVMKMPVAAMNGGFCSSERRAPGSLQSQTPLMHRLRGGSDRPVETVPPGCGNHPSIAINQPRWLVDKPHAIKKGAPKLVS